MMLIVDGVEYRPWTPSNEEAFESYIEAHSKRIFGEDSLYFPVKTKLKSLGGIGSIPDAYVVTLSKPHKWFIIEVELSSHPVFDHIVPQLHKFVQGLNPDSRKNLVRIIYDEITGDSVLQAHVRKHIGTGEIYRFLSETIDKAPELVVIIDEKTRELEEACRSIPIDNKHVVEFKVFERVDAGIKNAFLLETIAKKLKPSKPSPTKGKITPQSEYTLPILESLIELGGRGRVSDVLNKVYEKMKDRLTPTDLELVPSGKDPRWRSQAKWRRYELKKLGYLEADSPLGIWEITKNGRRYWEQNKPLQESS